MPESLRPFYNFLNDVTADFFINEKKNSFTTFPKLGKQHSKGEFFSGKNAPLYN